VKYRHSRSEAATASRYCWGVYKQRRLSSMQQHVALDTRDAPCIAAQAAVGLELHCRAGAGRIPAATPQAHAAAERPSANRCGCHPTSSSLRRCRSVCSSVTSHLSQQ
jgi:hypothetical protein